MELQECESVLSLLSSMKVKVQSALETINNCSSAESSTSISQSKSTSFPDKMDKSNIQKTDEASAASLPVSRDEVKAQREKKKAEKLAKKNRSNEKSKGSPAQPIEAESKGDSTKDTPEQSKSLLKDKNVEKPAAKTLQKNEIVDEGDKEVVSDANKGEKGKAQLKAERRALQEAQRAAKAAGSKENVKKQEKPGSESATPNTSKGTDGKGIAKTDSSKALPTTPATGGKQIPVDTTKEKLNTSVARSRALAKRPVAESKMQTLFDHLPHSGNSESLFSGSQHPSVDSAFLTLGQKYANGVFTSSKERCVQFIITLRQYIKVYRTPPGKDFRYALAQSLKSNIEFLQKCRPFAVAMENAVEHFNYLLRDLGHSELGQSELKIKEMLDEELIRFVEERINRAKDAIVREGKRKIKNGDVLLIFGCSELVWSIINEAAEKNSFCLVIVRDISQSNDSVGDKILSCIEGFINKRKSVGDTSVSVDYIGITGLSNRIQTVTKVLLDAEGLLANGKVMARAGTSEIALMASEHNIPVLVCCETYKFCDKSPTDSFSLNELKSRNDHIDSHDNYDGYLKTPELVYDITPSELVTAVITDVDMLPSTSVPVVLRVQENRSRNT